VILKLVTASSAEVELGALFVNTKEARVIRLFFAEIGHPQPPTQIHTDNTPAVGIVNSTFTLTADDFGAKYIGNEHAEYLMSVLGKYYNMEEDRKGNLYCDIHLK
jgi:hypothetical protein